MERTEEVHDELPISGVRPRQARGLSSRQPQEGADGRAGDVRGVRLRVPQREGRDPYVDLRPGTDPASAAPELRLLPWVTDAGNPCYLSGEADSVLAVYADELEDAQLADGARALRRIVELLDNVAAADDETAQTVKEAAAALSNVLRVADSRGARLPDAEEDAGHSPG